MPRRNAISSANATCAAARLTAAGVTATTLGARDSVSAAAVGRLVAGAAEDAERALASRAVRPRRLLVRAERQLRVGYVLSAELRAARDPAAVQAAVLFTAGARLAAAAFARLACRPGPRLRRSAVRALARTARMQTEIATTVAAIHRADSPELAAALRSALGAQQDLLAAVARTVTSAGLAPRHRRLLRSIAADAERVHDQLATALACARMADS